MNVNKVLIADDEPYVARVLKLVLQKEGYQVNCVNNGQQALAAYRETRPDIIVTDVKMPHMTGRELVEAIRGTDGDSQTPIVVMTSTLESENRDWVSGVDGVQFVGKPVSPRELVRIVNDCFACRKAS
jgi:two-component system alkaline phosphatase synthesis response regulator PhoP